MSQATQLFGTPIYHPKAARVVVPATRQPHELGPAGDDCDRRWGGRGGSLRRRLKRWRGCLRRRRALGGSRSWRWSRGGRWGRRRG